MLSAQHKRLLPLVMQERIDFSPHPKTLTMAGDYEYFAAQVSQVYTDIFTG